MQPEVDVLESRQSPRWCPGLATICRSGATPSRRRSWCPLRRRSSGARAAGDGEHRCQGEYSCRPTDRCHRVHCLLSRSGRPNSRCSPWAELALNAPGSAIRCRGSAAGWAEVPPELELRSTRRAVHRCEILPAVRTERDSSTFRQRSVTRSTPFAGIWYDRAGAWCRRSAGHARDACRWSVGRRQHRGWRRALSR